MRGLLNDGAGVRTAWAPVLGVLVLFAASGVVLAAGGARLILPDVCVESGDRTAVIPLVLTGADELRPSSLRTTVLFDPQIVAVEEVEDPSSEISLEEARWDDEGFEVGDVMEIPVDFEDFGSGVIDAAAHPQAGQPVGGQRSRRAGGIQGV